MAPFLGYVRDPADRSRWRRDGSVLSGLGLQLRQFAIIYVLLLVALGMFLKSVSIMLTIVPIVPCRRTGPWGGSNLVRHPEGRCRGTRPAYSTVRADLLCREFDPPRLRNHALRRLHRGLPVCLGQVSCDAVACHLSKPCDLRAELPELRATRAKQCTLGRTFLQRKFPGNGPTWTHVTTTNSNAVTMFRTGAMTGCASEPPLPGEPCNQATDDTRQRDTKSGCRYMPGDESIGLHGTGKARVH